MLPARAGTSKLIVLSISAFEYPLDLEGDLEEEVEVELHLEVLVCLTDLDSMVSEGTGTSSVVDHFDVATEAALALDVPSVFMDTLDFRPNTLAGKIEYLDSSE